MDCTFGTVGDDPSQVHPLDGRPFPSSGHVLPMCVFFFFQAEDGIRDGTVTGVQTCALPISSQPAVRVATAMLLSAFHFPHGRRARCCLASLISVRTRFDRQSPPPRRRHFLDQIELGLKPYQTAIEVHVTVCKILHLHRQRFHPVFDQNDFPDGRYCISRPTHLPFLRCYRTRST